MQKNERRLTRRHIAKGSYVVPRTGIWADEKCLVLEVEKRLHRSGSYKVVHVLLPNGNDRWYLTTQVTDVAGDESSLPEKPRRLASK